MITLPGRFKFLALTLSAFSCVVFAQQPQPFEEPPSPTVPYKFNSGDVISADVMNDLFGKISNVTDAFRNNKELVGTWSCTTYASNSSCSVPGFAPTGNGVLQAKSQNVSFTCNSEGTSCQQTFSTFWPGSCNTNSVSLTSSYEVVGNMLASPMGIYSIQKLSPISFNWNIAGSLPPQTFTVCKKVTNPPSIPTNLTGVVAGKSVTLTWTNAATDQTNFVVTRKDSLKGSYSERGNPTVTTFSETLGTGTYWYRVRAINANGSSLASNEVVIRVD